MQDIARATRSLFSPADRASGVPASPGGGAQPAGSPTGLLQEPTRGDKPEQRFPEPVFALAAPASVPHFPDAELLGGIAGCLKPGLAAGLVSGWEHGSSQGLGGWGGGLCPGTAFLPHCRQVGHPTSSPPGWGEQCPLLHYTPLSFPPCKAREDPIPTPPIPSQPIPSAGPAQPPTSPPCSQPRQRPWLVRHQEQLWPGQLELNWGEGCSVLSQKEPAGAGP